MPRRTLSSRPQPSLSPFSFATSIIVHRLHLSSLPGLKCLRTLSSPPGLVDQARLTYGLCNFAKIPSRGLETSSGLQDLLKAPTPPQGFKASSKFQDLLQQAIVNSFKISSGFDICIQRKSDLVSPQGRRLLRKD
ncbi:hypothetical protein C8F04DRAFT_1273280 [Mycena alexandri]|uniref:Uncharacterized protein n=1 Tax=Mycena alexandri TaxID=1745969 RepID=A0AAD6S5U3_9AGAR|nr:hypothetical protein C8F04DRAFT_1273280 [Mycena alexandri]